MFPPHNLSELVLNQGSLETRGQIRWPLSTLIMVNRLRHSSGPVHTTLTVTSLMPWSLSQLSSFPTYPSFFPKLIHLILNSIAVWNDASSTSLSKISTSVKWRNLNFTSKTFFKKWSIDNGCSPLFFWRKFDLLELINQFCF